MPVHAAAWTRVVCAGTPNKASMVTVYAPARTTVVVCAGTPRNKLKVTIDAPAWTKALVRAGTPNNESMVTVHAGAWTVTNDYVPQPCTPRIRTSTYAVPNTVVINMCESYAHIPLHSVPVYKLAVGEISLIATCMGVITY